MSLTTTITRSKPFYVVAGAGDVAVRTARQLPAQLRTVRIERKDIERAVATVQAEAIALPARAQTVAVTAAVDVADKADAVYGELLTRGRSVVGRIRRQQATQDLKKDAATTVRRTKATGSTAKKSAATTRSAAKGTTTTARKQAATTRKATRSATTSARKTTRTAGKATKSAASKVGS